MRPGPLSRGQPVGLAGSLPSARPIGCQPALLTLACACPPRGTTAPRAQELELRDRGRPVLIPQALAQPSMPRLRALNLDFGWARGDESFASLWAAPWFSQLQELSLTTGRGFGSPGLAPLRAAGLLRKLSITMHGDLTAADGRALAAAALPELRELQLLTAEPGLVAALAAAPWLSRLEMLDVASKREGPAGGLAAADSHALAAASLPSLKWLGIGGVAPGFMAACAAAAWLTRLEVLALRSKGGLIGDGGGLPEGFPVLPPFTTLAHLALSCDGVAPPSEVSRFAALVPAPWFGRLQYAALGGFPSWHIPRL
jgi:hypothetical protein